MFSAHTLKGLPVDIKPDIQKTDLWTPLMYSAGFSS